MIFLTLVETTEGRSEVEASSCPEIVAEAGAGLPGDGPRPPEADLPPSWAAARLEAGWVSLCLR